MDDEGRGADTELGASSGALTLRERWFACSSALGWSSPAEWPHTTVDRVCASVCARFDGREGRSGLEKALGRWAGARAGAGVGLAETLSDLAALHTAVSGFVPPETANRLLAPAAPVAPAPVAPAEGVPAESASLESAPADVAPASVAEEPAPAPRALDGARLLRVVALGWTDVACGDLAETRPAPPVVVPP